MKKSFTFGELAVVSQILTLVAVEAWVITINKVIQKLFLYQKKKKNFLV